MAKLNGATACRHIVSRDPAARVILISGWTPPYDPRESGAIGVLSKPVDLAQLEKALNQAKQLLPLTPAPVRSPNSLS